MRRLTTKEAVVQVTFVEGRTKYLVAKMLDVNVSSINQWLRRTKMSEPIAKKFAEVFGIKITDVYIPDWKKQHGS